MFSYKVGYEGTLSPVLKVNTLSNVGLPIPSCDFEPLPNFPKLLKEWTHNCEETIHCMFFGGIWNIRNHEG